MIFPIQINVSLVKYKTQINPILNVYQMNLKSSQYTSKKLQKLIYFPQASVNHTIRRRWKTKWWLGRPVRQKNSVHLARQWLTMANGYNMTRRGGLTTSSRVESSQWKLMIAERIIAECKYNNLQQ